MRIRNISIRGLFGSFDHRIPLFQREPITLIHGPNGVGKTSILRLIYGTLRPAYSHLRHIPFRELELEFFDGTALIVTPIRSDNNVRAPTAPNQKRVQRARLRFTLTRHGETLHEFIQSATSASARISHLIDASVPFLRHIGPDEWHDPNFQRVLTTDEVIELYGIEVPEEMGPPEEIDWLHQIQIDTPVHFIETQRLLDTRPSPSRPKVPQQQSAVMRCASEFADHIRSTFARATSQWQLLERSFPARLLSEEGPGPLSEEGIRSRLTDLDRRRSRLVEAGLLEAGYEPALPTKRFDETTQRVLAVYIRDTEEKLGVFDDLLRRIELIKSIVDSRFLQKTLTVDRDRGFVVKSLDNRPVRLTDLSSGEQHELVLLYELLFRARPDTLILIDEPELSLHIAWQQQFLRDLLQITKVADLQALIATHSPQIIHDRWDLTVELLGPSK